MDRRTFLASAGTGAAGIALAGCLGAPEASGSPGSSKDPASTYRITDLSTATTKASPAYEWLVQVTEEYSSGADQKPSNATVLDVSEIEDEDLRAVVKETIREGEVETNETPEGLHALLDRVDRFTWDARNDTADTATQWKIERYDGHPDRSPVAFDARVRDATVSADDPGAIDFSLTNEGDQPYTIYSRTVPPFSLLWAEERDGHDRFLLWRDYAEEGCVTIHGERGIAVCDVLTETPIQPGETITRTYRIQPGKPESTAIAAGRFVVRDTLTYHVEQQAPTHNVNWEVTFTLEDA